MPDFHDDDFDPNALFAQHPDQWDQDTRNLAAIGGLAEQIDTHAIATGQLPGTETMGQFAQQIAQDYGAKSAPVDGQNPAAPSTDVPAPNSQSAPTSTAPSPKGFAEGILDEAQRNGGWLSTEGDKPDPATGHPDNTKQCTALVKHVAKLGPTSTWKEGTKLTPDTIGQLQTGTPIATFTNGKYVNAEGGANHAAIVKNAGTTTDGRPYLDVVEQAKLLPAQGSRYFFDTNDPRREKNLGNYSVIR